jgi:AsmA protein
MRGESTILKMKLRGENMPAEDLEALLPAIGVTLPKGASLQGGTLNADLAIEGPVEKLEAAGTVGLVNTRLTGFDLGGKMASVASLAGIKSSSVTEIEKFTSDLRVAPDGIQVSSLLLAAPALGQLTGNGTVGSNYSLDFKMLAKLNASGGAVGNLARLAGVKGSNELNVPFFIRGTTLNPTFVPDVKGAAGSLLESSIAGKDTKAGETKPAQNLGGLLRGVLEKKKK